jgi:membrane protein YqaA with SNARE-associated domain
MTHPPIEWLIGSAIGGVIAYWLGTFFESRKWRKAAERKSNRVKSYGKTYKITLRYQSKGD